jgi:hypothetical protein
MKQKTFTEQEVVTEARKQYGKPVCLDMLEDAMRQETLEEAVRVIVLDSAYWDGEL